MRQDHTPFIPSRPKTTGTWVYPMMNQPNKVGSKAYMESADNNPALLTQK